MSDNPRPSPEECHIAIRVRLVAILFLVGVLAVSLISRCGTPQP